MTGAPLTAAPPGRPSPELRPIGGGGGFDPPDPTPVRVPPVVVTPAPPPDPPPAPAPPPVAPPDPAPVPVPAPPVATVPQGPQLPSGADAGSLAVFPDRAVADWSWYVPGFAVVAPDPATLPAASPFGYRFAVSGHDPAGHPILDATITARVRTVLTDDVRAQLTAPDRCSPVPLDDLQPALVIPYRDSATGLATCTAIPATSATPTATADGDSDGYDLVFAVHGDLARAAYGSLSTPGYQTDPARLSIQVTFTAVTLDYRQLLQRIPGLTVADTAVITRLAFTAPPAGPPANPPVDPPIRSSVDVTAALGTGLRARSRVAAPALFAAPALIAAPSVADLAIDPTAGDEGLVARRPTPPPARWFTGWSTVPISRTQTLDLFVGCADFPQLYVDATDPADPQPVGCASALALGQLPPTLYTEVPALADDGYRVFASVSRPAVYLLLPRRYRIGRAAAGQPGSPAWTPEIQWTQAFDAQDEVSLPCHLHANLQPDVGPGDLESVLATLAGRHPGTTPTLLLPTSPGSGLAGFTVTGWNSGDAFRTSLDGDTIDLAADLDFADAVILNGVLAGGAADVLVGNAGFSLSDGSTLGPVELHVDVVRLTGPWPGGPVVATPNDASSVIVTNNAENDALVTRILLDPATGGGGQVIADGLAVTVPAGTALAVPTTGTTGPGRLVADATVGQSSAAVIENQRLYIEDLQTTVTVIDDGALASQAITSVDVSAHLDGDPQGVTFSLNQAVRLFQIVLVRPIAGGQDQSELLHLTGIVHPSSGADTVTGDLLVDLTRGVIVHLSDILATAPAPTS